MLVVVSSDFCTLSYHFVLFGGPFISQLSKYCVFQKLGVELDCSNLPVLSLMFVNCLFMFAKTL